jgi:hypothetical protein
MRLVYVGLFALAAILLLAAVLLAGCENEEGAGVASPTPYCTIILGDRICPSQSAVDCRPSVDHIPFIRELVLPGTLPEGLDFYEGCVTAEFPGLEQPIQAAEIKYRSADEKAKFQVSTARFGVQPNNREAIQLGPVTGFITRTPRADGSEIYGVEFPLGPRAYTVIAILGPENRLTEADLNAIALQMVEGALQTPSPS